MAVRPPFLQVEKAVERPIATVPQVDALACAVGMRWRLMVYLGAYGPMRPEELAGRRRRDVDLDTLRIRVRLAEPERMNGRRVQGDTKSVAGSRAVVLPVFLRRELRWHLESYAEAGPDGLIFVGEKGAPFRRSTFGKKWRRARALVGMPEGFRFTISATSVTLCPRAAMRRSRTRWCGPASPPRRRR